MNPYFSKVKVASQQDLVRRHMDRLFERLEAFVAPKRIFNFGAATTAFVRDVTNEFVLGKNYNSLGREDFDVAQLATSQGSGAVWRLTKFFRFVGPTVQALPPSLLLKISHGPFREFVLFLQVSRPPAEGHAHVNVIALGIPERRSKTCDRSGDGRQGIQRQTNFGQRNHRLEVAGL